MSYINIDNMKSYATEANLMTALKKHGIDTHRFIVVCNRSGRFTAIFSLAANNFKGGYIGVYSDHGFLTLN